MNEFTGQIESNTDSTRKLVTIQKIKSISPIPDADAIEVAEVLGYKVVVKKNEFKIGDKCVFFEIDSILPVTSWSDFLKDKHDPTKPIRLKTIKLRKQISQGLALPLAACSLIDTFYHDGSGVWKEALPVGLDLTSTLGVTKYEPVIPAQLFGKIKGKFPSFLIKSDQKNIQTYPDVLREIQGKNISVTLKMDGTSVTFYNNPDLTEKGKEVFGVCSRNLDLKPDETIYWKMAQKYDIERKMKDLFPWYAVQGECYGPGIQDNRMGAKENLFAAYDIIDIRDHRFVGWDKFKDITGALGLPTVPVVFEGICPWSSYEEVMQFADQQMYAQDLPAEGIVIKTVDEDYSNVLDGRLSFKAISRVFKLKYPRA